MKVLFISRSSVFASPGGDTIQMEKTGEYLQRHGVTVEIATTVSPAFEQYDLLHFFNLKCPQDLLRNVRRAKKLGVPTVLSTIWGSYLEGDRAVRKGIDGWLARNLSESQFEFLKNLARSGRSGDFSKNTIAYVSLGHRKAIREIVEAVDLLLPNSPGELERVRADSGVIDKAGRVVVNAIDPKNFDHEQVVVAADMRRFEGCILSVARIEPRKNQLNLIRAANQLSHHLVLVGQPSANHQAYYQQCRREANSNVEFLGQRGASELAQLYKAAKAHALVSWMDTPGLSSLEAGAMGCNLLVTDRGDTQYYFGDAACYVEPGGINSIREGITKVMSMTGSDDLRSRICENFTWEKTAEQTFEAYCEVLGESEKARGNQASINRKAGIGSI